MNIFFFELKAQAKSAAVWAVSLLGLFIAFGAAFFGPFIESRTAVEKALESLPPAFSLVFGIEMDTIFTFGGFYQFIYTYIGLVGAIMAASVGIAAFSREKRSKCSDFLLVKPVSRRGIFLAKLLACLALLAAVNILFVAASIFSYTGNGQDPSGLGTVVWASLSLLFLQVVFLALGTFAAVFSRKVRSVSGAAMALGFSGFLLMALQSLVKEDALRYLSPLTYFNPGTVFAQGQFEAPYAAAAALVVLACLALSYTRFCRSDTPTL